MLHDHVVGVARHVDNFRFWTFQVYLLGQLTSTHSRHDHIGEKKMNALSEAIGEFESLVGTGGLEDSVSVALKEYLC